MANETNVVPTRDCYNPSQPEYVLSDRPAKKTSEAKLTPEPAADATSVEERVRNRLRNVDKREGYEYTDTEVDVALKLAVSSGIFVHRCVSCVLCLTEKGAEEGMHLSRHPLTFVDLAHASRGEDRADSRKQPVPCLVVELRF